MFSIFSNKQYPNRPLMLEAHSLSCLCVYLFLKNKRVIVSRWLRDCIVYYTVKLVSSFFKRYHYFLVEFVVYFCVKTTFPYISYLLKKKKKKSKLRVMITYKTLKNDCFTLEKWRIKTLPNPKWTLSINSFLIQRTKRVMITKSEMIIYFIY